jgi:hypothetical protein
MPDSCGYPARETYVDDKGIARITEPLTATSGQGPAGCKGARVGRMVHYYRQAPVRLPLREQSPQPAVITEIHDQVNGFVGLEVFGQPEKVLHRSVPFHPSPRPGCWTWMPRD